MARQQKGDQMSGRTRLPGGAMRKASQRKARPAVASAPIVRGPIWRPGDAVRWKAYTGHFLQAADDDAEMIEIMIGQRRYRVPLRELLPG
jgi:hypothetical protein